MNAEDSLFDTSRSLRGRDQETLPARCILCCKKWTIHPAVQRNHQCPYQASGSMYDHRDNAEEDKDVGKGAQARSEERREPEQTPSWSLVRTKVDPDRRSTVKQSRSRKIVGQNPGLNEGHKQRDRLQSYR